MAYPYKKTRLPRQRKTIMVKASDSGTGRQKEDAGYLFRCWNCGWICDIRRDELSDGRNGVTYTADESTATMPDTAIPGSMSLVSTGVEVADAVERKVDAAGDSVVVKVYYDRHTSGCPFCGSRAWKK